MLTSHSKTIAQILGRSPIHPFPARMAPGIALDAIGRDSGPLTVLDPMAGSGTVLAVASANGHRAIGFDLDPLSVLLANVWTRHADSRRAEREAHFVLERANARFRLLSAKNAYPKRADEETRSFLRYWFDPIARRQLTALSRAIECVAHRPTRDLLWCGFSRLIITKSAGASRAMDLSHSRPHRAFKTGPIRPFDRFLEMVRIVAENCPESPAPSTQTPVVKRGDARRLGLPSASVDLVLTSPPYLNAIDYMRCSKFSLVWMGFSVEAIRQIRGNSVGAEAALQDASRSAWVGEVLRGLNLAPPLSSRHSGLLARYVWDMGKALNEASRVLRAGGRAVYVVGDSTIKGTFVRNSAIVSSAALASGLRVTSRHVRTLPSNRRYLPPPRAGGSSASMDGRMRREVVVVLEKP